MEASAGEKVATDSVERQTAIGEMPAERHGEVVGVPAAQVVGVRIAFDREMVEPHL